MDNPCWKGYEAIGLKKKNGKTVPNCVPKHLELGSTAEKVKSKSVLKKTMSK